MTKEIKCELWDLVELNEPKADHVIKAAIKQGIILEDIRFCISLMRLAEKTCPAVYRLFREAGLRAYN